MPSQTDLHDEILRQAAELFMKQSYAATSIKQIAKAAGCTTAALYYYFEDGKESILREVVDRAMPNLEVILEPLQGMTSFKDLIMALGVSMWNEGDDILHRTRWLIVEFPNLEEAVRAKLHSTLRQFHQSITDLIEPFVEDRPRAEVMAWIAFTAMFGYGQLFVTLDLQSAFEPPHEPFVYMLAEMFAKMEKNTS